MNDTICIFGVSEIGKVRPDNRDAVLINGIIERGQIEMRLSRNGLFYKHHGLLCAVADGIGGQKGGAMASHQVLLGLSTEMLCLSSYPDCQKAGEYLEILINRLHNSIIRQSKLNAGLAGMGTTLTGFYLRPDYGIYFHAGDSRLYRFRGDFLMQLTTDHVLENMTGIPGENTTQNFKSGIITNCIGGGSSSVCQVETGALTLDQNDILMLCSDGLSDMLSAVQIENIISANRENLAKAAKQLLAAANEAGGRDNISVIIIGGQENEG